MLCMKETKGEVHQYLKFMGRTNWALKNVTKAQLVALFIPGFQVAAVKADKLKKIIQTIQNAHLILYYKKLTELKTKSCPLDPRLFMTPFHVTLAGYKRGLKGTATLRSNEWTYYFLQKPYALGLTINVRGYEDIRPSIKYTIKESAVTSSFLSSFP